MLPTASAPPHRADGLAAAYRRLIDVCPALRVSIVGATSEPDPTWVRTDGTASAVEGLIAFESTRIAMEHGTAPPAHVAASRLLHDYLWSVSLLISGHWYLTQQVPELLASDLWIDPPTADLALRPGRCAPGGPDALRDAVVAHLEPVIAAFQPFTKRGPRALWGMVADDLVSGIWYLARMLGEEARGIELASAVLAGDQPRLPGSANFRLLSDGEARARWTRTRLGCCLYYAIGPTESCLTCPRTSDAERIRRLAAEA